MSPRNACGRQITEAGVWPAEFTKRRALKGNPNQFFLDNQTKRNLFKTFFKHNSVSTRDFRTLRNQFQGYSLEDVDQGKHGAGTRKAAFVDERGIPDDEKPAIVRTKGNDDLTPQQLLVVLQVPVCFHTDLL
jgi:hypothetical protein